MQKKNKLEYRLCISTPQRVTIALLKYSQAPISNKVLLVYNRKNIFDDNSGKAVNEIT